MRKNESEREREEVEEEEEEERKRKRGVRKNEWNRVEEGRIISKNYCRQEECELERVF